MTEFVEKAEKSAKAEVEALSKGTARAVCFTAHDFTAEHVEKLKDLVQSGAAKYLVFQHEICPSSGKEHLQGYIEWPTTGRWNKINTIVGFNAHIEKRRGTPQQAADYCKKEDTRKRGTQPFEAGVLSLGQGARSDLLDIQTQLNSGTKTSAIARTNFASWTKYHKAFDKYQEIIVPPRSRCTVSIVLWGESDSGKTRTVRGVFPDAYWISVGNGGVWWDKYEQHEAVVFDEFTGWIKFMDFKRLIDSSPYVSDCKGAQKTFTSRFVAFTSNSSPQEWYDREKDVDKEAFARRIHIELEAKKLTNPAGDEKVVCVVRKCMLPWNANMPPKWTLPGLTSAESFSLINPECPEYERKRIGQKCPIVTMLRSNEVLRSGGVILDPPLVREMGFADAARSVLRCVLDGRETASSGAPAPVSDEKFAQLLAESSKKQVIEISDDVVYNPNAPDSPVKTLDVLEHSDEDCRMDGLKRQGAQYFQPTDFDGPAQAARPAVPKRPPVRHDQVLKRDRFKTNYPGFGVSAFDHGSDEEQRVDRFVDLRKRRPTAPPASPGASDDGFPSTKRVPFYRPDRERDRDEHDVGFDDEQRSEVGDYEEDSFLEDDMPRKKSKKRLGSRRR